MLYDTLLLKFYTKLTSIHGKHRQDCFEIEPSAWVLSYIYFLFVKVQSFKILYQVIDWQYITLLSYLLAYKKTFSNYVCVVGAFTDINLQQTYLQTYKHIFMFKLVSIGC